MTTLQDVKNVLDAINKELAEQQGDKNAKGDKDNWAKKIQGPNNPFGHLLNPLQSVVKDLAQVLKGNLNAFQNLHRTLANLTATFARSAAQGTGFGLGKSIVSKITDYLVIKQAIKSGEKKPGLLDYIRPTGAVPRMSSTGFVPKPFADATRTYSRGNPRYNPFNQPSSPNLPTTHLPAAGPPTTEKKYVWLDRDGNVKFSNVHEGERGRNVKGMETLRQGSQKWKQSFMAGLPPHYRLPFRNPLWPGPFDSDKIPPLPGFFPNISGTPIGLGTVPPSPSFGPQSLAKSASLLTGITKKRPRLKDIFTTGITAGRGMSFGSTPWSSLLAPYPNPRPRDPNDDRPDSLFGSAPVPYWRDLKNFGKRASRSLGKVAHAANNAFGWSKKTLSGGWKGIGDLVSKGIGNLPRSGAGTIVQAGGAVKAVTSGAGLLGTEAVSGSAAALASNPVGWAIAAGVAVAAVVAAMAAMPFIVKSFGESLLESQRHLAESSGAMAQVFARWDTFNTLRNQRIGNKTAGTAGRLESSLERLMTEMEPIIVGFMNGLNLTLTALVEMGRDILETLTAGVEATISMNPALLAIWNLLQAQAGDQGETGETVMRDLTNWYDARRQQQQIGPAAGF